MATGTGAGVIRNTCVGSAGADAAMERYANGDDSAFADVYDQLAPLLLERLGERTNSAVRVETILEATFDHLRRRRGTFSTGGEVTLWAQAIALRLMADSIARDFKQARIPAKWIFDAVERSLADVEEFDRELAKLLSQSAVASLSALFAAERQSGAARDASLRRAEAALASLRTLVGDVRSRSHALPTEAVDDTLLLQQRVAALVRNYCRPETPFAPSIPEKAERRRWWDVLSVRSRRGG